MKEPNDRLIDNYIDKITALNQNYPCIPTPEELDRTVSELGITDEQIAVVQSESKKYLVRAKSYIKIKQWDDAIAQLLEGISLAPSNLEMISCLGEAYMGRWQIKHKRQDILNIQSTANKCLQIKPDCDAAINLLSKLNRSIRWRKNSRIMFSFISVSTIISVVMPTILMHNSSTSILLSNPLIASILNPEISVETARLKDSVKYLENEQFTLKEEMSSLQNQQSILKSELLMLQKKQGGNLENKLNSPAKK